MILLGSRIDTRISTGPKLAPLADREGPTRPPAPAKVWQGRHLTSVKSFLSRSKLRLTKPSTPAFSSFTKSVIFHFVVAGFVCFLSVAGLVPAPLAGSLTSSAKAPEVRAAAANRAAKATTVKQSVMIRIENPPADSSCNGGINEFPSQAPSVALVPARRADPYLSNFIFISLN